MSPQIGDAARRPPRRSSGWSGWKPGETIDELRVERDELVGHVASTGCSQQSAPITSSSSRRSSSTVGGDDEHVGAELGERVGDGEAGDPEAEHGDPEAAPVGVPAGQSVELDASVRRTAQRLTHSR